LKTNNISRVIKKIGITSVFLCIILTQFITILHADSAMLRTVVSKNDLSSGGDFWLDLQIKITDGTSPRTLNSFTADVYYTSTISYNGSAECDWAFSFMQGYGSFTASDLSGYVRLGCTAPNVGFGADGWDVTTEWQRIVTVKFTITTATNTNISINDNTDAAAYFNNLHNNPAWLVTDWTMSNEDTGHVTLPVVLSVFTCQYLNNKAELYWVTESETDNLGWYIYRNETSDFNTADKINDEFIEGHGTTTEQSHYLYSDNILSPNSGDKFLYWLVNISYSGIIHTYGPTMMTIPEFEPQQNELDIPETFGLFQNNPNPFNPEIEPTHLYFHLPVATKMVLKIYNSKGQFIKKIYEGISDKGAYCWDGTDYNGMIVPTGIYLYILEANTNNDILIKKMIILN